MKSFFLRSHKWQQMNAHFTDHMHDMKSGQSGQAKRSLLAIHKIWIRLTFISSFAVRKEMVRGEIGMGQKMRWRHSNRLREEQPRKYQQSKWMKGITLLILCIIIFHICWRLGSILEVERVDVTECRLFLSIDCMVYAVWSNLCSTKII